MGLRTRLLAAFLLPVLFVGVGGLLLIGLPGPALRPGSEIHAGLLYLALVILALLVSIGCAIQMGDRIVRPVAWMLRLMEAGQLRLLGRSPAPAADWEIGSLARRVQVLLKQNLTGARAMEELEALRSEVIAVLDAAVVGRLDPERWPREMATHPQTRRLLDFFRVREESLQDAAEGLGRLQALLEEDWRSESTVVEDLAARSERAFLGLTELALELERLERLARPGIISPGGRADDPAVILAELQTGFRKWQAEVAALLADREREEPPARLRDWGAWVTESLALLAQAEAGRRDAGRAERLSADLEKVSRRAADAGQELGALSREAARLLAAWQPLGERLRSLMVRMEELQGGPAVRKAAADAAEEGSESGE